MNSNAIATRKYEDLRKTGGTKAQWIECAIALEAAAAEAPVGCNAGEALMDRAESARMNARRD
jgi:hypothetical protein